VLFRSYFFLNEHLVHTSDFYPFYGNQIGFQDNQNTTMRVSFLKVSYLRENPTAYISTVKQIDTLQSSDYTGFCGSFGLGYVHSMGEIRDLWNDGFDADLIVGYWLLPHYGLECGFNLGFTGISEDKKVTVDVVSSSGGTDTRTTSGGVYCSFPLGLRYTCPIFSSSKYYLTIGAGGDYYFEDETGMGDVTDYTSRGSSGFGYYARISFASMEGIDVGVNLGWALQIKYVANYANVGDFYNVAPGFVGKSHASDGRLVVVLEMCWF
jgi:hypothetical protein